MTAPATSQSGKCTSRFIDTQNGGSFCFRSFEHSIGQLVHHQCGNGTRTKGSFYEIVAINAFAWQGNVHKAGLHLAGIPRYTACLLFKTLRLY